MCCALIGLASTVSKSRHLPTPWRTEKPRPGEAEEASVPAMSISEEALRNLLRHLSSALSAPYGSSLVTPEDALSCVHPLSSLRNVTLACFTHILVVEYRNGWHYCDKATDWSGRGLVFEAFLHDPEKLQAWIKIAGEFLTELTFDVTVCRTTLRLLKDK